MQDFTDTISTPYTSQIKAAHEDLSRADRTLVHNLIEQLAKTSREVLYLDDLEVQTIDRAGDSPHDHVNQKEVISGDATAWFAVEDGHGEIEKQFEIQYEVHAGSQKSVDGFIYDPIEVSVIFK